MKLQKHTYALKLLFVLLMLNSCGIQKSKKDLPDISNYELSSDNLVKVNDSLFFKGSNSLRKNEHGQWELVASGNPYDLGNSIGLLAEDLIVRQEELFFEKFKKWCRQNLSKTYCRTF